MSYYNTCPECGANLDPGEGCDCKEQRSFERFSEREICDFSSQKRETSKDKTETCRCDCIVNSEEVTVRIKKAPEKVTISTGAKDDAINRISIAISLYYENNKKSRRRLK